MAFIGFYPVCLVNPVRPETLMGSAAASAAVRRALASNFLPACRAGAPARTREARVVPRRRVTESSQRRIRTKGLRNTRAKLPSLKALQPISSIKSL